MNIIIECTNFKPSKALNTFIEEKCQTVLKLDARISRMEFKIGVQRMDHTKSFSCSLAVTVPGNDVVVRRTSDEAHDVVLKAIDGAKRGLRKLKTKRIAARRSVAE